MAQQSSEARRSEAPPKVPGQRTRCTLPYELYPVSFPDGLPPGTSVAELQLSKGHGNEDLSKKRDP